MPAKKKETAEITIAPLRRGSAKLRIIGVTPLYQNRMSAKAKQQLLVGSRKKTKADKLNIKHDPLEEFRDAAERLKDGPTALGMKITAIKSAMATAALETPGLTKTSTQRLLFMPADKVPLYGTPQLRLDVVRSADINRTPDIRSRSYLPQWGAEVEVHYAVPQLSLTAVVTLLCNAGMLIGVGDNRQEKGKGNYGLFRVLGEGEKDAEWDDLVKNHGRAAQSKALDNPEYADDETAELMEFFFEETMRRAA
jgi:hypothetical protein